MNQCRSGCHAPGSHRTLGECMRSANIRIGQVDATRERRWSAELEAYRSARAQGIQPRTTRLEDTRAALDASDLAGAAYSAGGTA